MSTNTGIQWTDHSQNFWWGCIKVAQGCKNCYAEGVATRFYGRKVWGPNSERRIASEKIWNDPARWNAQAEREGRRFKVFCMSMGDFLEDHPQLVEPRKRAVGIIESTPFLDWQILTKRPENHPMLGWGKVWPSNVWFGASAANHDEFATVGPIVAGVPAAVRFLSLEPLIGPILIPEWWTPVYDNGAYRGYQLPGEKDRCHGTGPIAIDWIICGGESGQAARSCHLEWLREIVIRLKDAKVPCFVKQLGSDPHEWDCGQCVSVKLNDPKGGDISEWPEDLRVRQFPTTEKSNAPS